MNLNNFETEINPTILQRGINYFNDQLVEDLEETEPGVWEAIIAGTDIYDIEVEVKQTNHS